MQSHTNSDKSAGNGLSHTPGAIRAGRNISARFRKALPNLPESNAETLAAIIDKETAAPEMLEALEMALTAMENYVRGEMYHIGAVTTAKKAIRKAKGDL